VVLDPTAKQFGAEQRERYSLEELRRRWGKLYYLNTEAAPASAEIPVGEVIPVGRCYDYAHEQAKASLDRPDVEAHHQEETQEDPCSQEGRALTCEASERPRAGVGSRNA